MKNKFNLNIIDKNKNSDVKYDPFTSLVGHLGSWQLRIFVPIIFVKLSSGWVQLMILFLTPKTNFWCVEFESETNMTIGNNKTCYKDCVSYKYDSSPFDNTIVSEWDLICERGWLASFTQTVLQFGILIGSILFGFLSDRYGRRHTFLSSVTLVIIFGFLLPFSGNYILFTTYRFCLGLATAGTMVISFVIVMETIGSKYIEIAGCLFHIPFILGHLTIPLFAYFLRNWQDYTLGLAIPPVLYLSYFFIVKESPRWLMSVGKVDKAVEIVTEAAILNKLPTTNIVEEVTKISNDIISNKSKDPKKNYIDLFRTPTLRLRTIVCGFIWLVGGLGFFGVNQYISQTSPNPFISVVAAAVMQIPSNLLAMWMIRKLGRRLCIISFLLIGGVSMLLLGWVPDIFAVTFIIGTLGVCAIAIVCTALYIYSSELFPTVTRNMGLGLMSTAMRVGSMLAPFVSNLSTAMPWLPTLIFGVTPLVAACACLLLPETQGKKLPDNIDDIEL